MWECNFENEAVDFKLLGLRLFRKIWIFFSGILLGVLFIGGGYFLKKVVLAPEKEYKVVAETYIEYALEEGQPVESVCFNQTTWASLLRTDAFVDDIVETLKKQGFAVTKAEVADSVDGTLLSDVRIVTTTVTTKDPALSVAMSRALQEAVIHFGEEQKEIAGTRILTSPEEAEPVILDVRTLRAVILGGVIGGFLSLMAMLLYFTLDDSVYLPVTFERRYKIPMLGTLASKELPVNFAYLLKDCRTVAVTAAEADIPVEEITESLLEKLQKSQERVRERLQGTEAADCASEKNVLPKLYAAGCVEEKPELVQALREVSGVVLVAASGRHDGKRIEKLIGFLQKQDVEVKCALLWDADESLIRCYYGCLKTGRKR